MAANFCTTLNRVDNRKYEPNKKTYKAVKFDVNT